jgi:hypothetical protein
MLDAGFSLQSDRAKDWRDQLDALILPYHLHRSPEFSLRDG